MNLINSYKNFKHFPFFSIPMSSKENLKISFELFHKFMQPCIILLHYSVEKKQMRPATQIYHRWGTEKKNWPLGFTPEKRNWGLCEKLRKMSYENQQQNWHAALTCPKSNVCKRRIYSDHVNNLQGWILMALTPAIPFEVCLGKWKKSK